MYIYIYIYIIQYIHTYIYIYVIYIYRAYIYIYNGDPQHGSLWLGVCKVYIGPIGFCRVCKQGNMYAGESTYDIMCLQATHSLPASIFGFDRRFGSRSGDRRLGSRSADIAWAVQDHYNPTL